MKFELSRSFIRYGIPTIAAAPMTEPAIEPRPPTRTTAKYIMTTSKLKLSDETLPW
jgi:hypothetical protein